MRDAEGLARRGLDEAAANRVARREGHGVHEDVEAAPLALPSVAKPRVDLVVAGDVQLEHGARAELRGQRLDAILEALLSR